ncbi:MAG: YkgJ family cysteine cluster protein [Desulfosalsimonas sp.]
MPSENKRADRKTVYGARQEVTGKGFYFACHEGVACFTRCCRNPDMYLYPYDIIRLKNRLGLDSATFLERHTRTAVRDNPYFPHVMLKMAETDGRPCPFLTAGGCSVYEDRPFSCRAYPLEPALARGKGGGNNTEKDRFFIARHPYCQGHEQDVYWLVEQWIEDQGLGTYMEANRRWVDIDTLLRRDCWGGSGFESPAFRMVFMACFNPDSFREFVFSSSFLDRFALSGQRTERVGNCDEDLLLLGFDWVEFLLAGKGPLSECVKK